MEPLETLQAINLAVQTLAIIEELSIDDNIKEQLTNKVLSTIGIEQQKVKKYTPGSQQKIIEALSELGGQAVRSQIVEATGLDPNSVSSLLNKLVKVKKVQKIAIQKFEDENNKNGRGLPPDYMYFLLKKMDD